MGRSQTWNQWVWALGGGALGASTGAVILVACGSVLGARQPPTLAAASVAEAVADAPAAAPTEPAEPPVDLVDVAAPREFRGLWVATVFNLDYPSRAGLSPTAGRAELARLVDTAAAAGMNALVFQVRPEGDALYASDLEPWSRYLTGKQGGNPGYDPLETLVELAHAKNMEVHAWFNPYRAAANRGDTRSPIHVSRVLPGAVRTWGRTLWLDPGFREVQDHSVRVIEDVVKRYDIDGVHIDDYFYPYPDGARSFPDGDSYAQYLREGGSLGRSAWRRSNVDTLVQRIHDTVEEHCEDCRMGISPFGIYRPGTPAGARGLDQVAALNADPLLWYRESWADYLAPQLYWSTKKSGQRYGMLLDWWDAQVAPERPLLVGLDATKVGSTPEWSLDEYRTQVRLARAAPSTLGQIWFRAKPVMTNQAGLRDLLMNELYTMPALPPPMPGLAQPAAPEVVPSGATVTLVGRGEVRGYAVYRGEALVFDRLLPPHATEVELEPGVWAVSQVAPGAMESRAVRFTIPDPLRAEPAEG